MSVNCGYFTWSNKQRASFQILIFRDDIEKITKNVDVLCVVVSSLCPVYFSSPATLRL